MWTTIILRPLFWTINHCASTTFLNTTVQFSRIKMWSLSPEKKNVILALKNCAPHCRLSLTDMFEAMPRKFLGFPMFDWLSVLRLVVHYFINTGLVMRRTGSENKFKVIVKGKKKECPWASHLRKLSNHVVHNTLSNTQANNFFYRFCVVQYLPPVSFPRWNSNKVWVTLTIQRQCLHKARYKNKGMQHFPPPIKALNRNYRFHSQ